MNRYLGRLFRSRTGSSGRPIESPSTYVAQAGQNVFGSQTNIANVSGDVNIGRAKLPPHIERFIFRMNRRAQCDALLAHLSRTGAHLKPICAVAFGIEDDLPNKLAGALFEYVQHDVLGTRGLRPFLPPKNPICRPWPRTCQTSDALWNEIGTLFMDLAALQTPGNVMKEFEKRPGGIAFGFELDVSLWNKYGATLTDWIHSLRQCGAPPQSVALALMVISGSSSSTNRLEALRKQLASRYDNDDFVLVLPPLEPIEHGEFKTWHRQLEVLAAAEANEGDLATMTLTLYPNETTLRRLGEIWDPVRAAMYKAWSS
jgi:hypothetical protein